MVKLLSIVALATAATSAQVTAWDVFTINATNPHHEPVRRNLAVKCELRTNVDFAGSDLKNVQAPVTDCCSKCAALSGCKAFSWTDYNGGTCWLKSGTGTVSAKTGVISAELKTVTSDAVCTTETDVDYIGNDVANALGSASDCCAKCAAIATCNAYSWSNFNGGTCWFKSSKGATKITSGVISGQVSTTTPVPTTVTPPPTTVTPPPTTVTPPPTTTTPAPKQCTVEVDIDYVGNDLSNTPGAAADCCAKCRAVNNCGAYSWSNYNGGTCWLKTGKGTTKASSGVISGVVATVTPTTPPPTTVTPPPTTVTPPPTTVTPPPTTVTPPPTTVTPPPSQQCVVENDIDYVGNDLTNVLGSASECCAKCRAVANCGAYTWSNFNGGTCWLKTSKGATKASSGAISGVVTSATPLPTTVTPVPTTVTPTPTTVTPVPTTLTPGQQCQIEKGVDYVANDLVSVPGADSTACCSKCLDVPGCNAFSWSSGVCYLKSAKGATTANANVESGVVSRPPPTNSCSIEENVGFAGLDIANRPASTAEDCCGICASYSGCGAFTWTNYNGGTCWLKSDKGQTSTVAGSRSARVVVTNAPRTHIQYSIRSRAVKAKSVNLGNWLVGEYWLWYTSPAWTNVWSIGYQGEYIAIKTRGHAAGDAGWKTHRDQWITEDDIRQIAAAGLNSVRVPVGYWIVGDDSSITKNYDMSVHTPGALKYLDILINEWAVKYNVAVILSLHAHMGSQNGFDHSAPRAFGQVQWGWGETFDNSIQFSTFLAARYKLSPAFLGMSLMNEPNLNINQDAMKEYYKQSYAKIRATGNDCILITSPHLNDQGPYAMGDFMTTGYYNVWHEWHVYFKWGVYAGMNDGQLVQAARDYANSHLNGGWKGNPIYMGEWSLTSPTNTFTNDASLRNFFNAQMDVYKNAGAGWAYWTWKHADEDKMDQRGWSLHKMIQLGIAKF